MYSVNKVHFYINYIPLCYLFAITNEPLSIVKSIFDVDMFENTRCLDLSNATVLSPFAMLCGTNRTAKLSSNCLHKRHPRPLTCIYGKSAMRVTRGDLDNAMALARRRCWCGPCHCQTLEIYRVN